jgi:hypothetical protein
MSTTEFKKYFCPRLIDYILVVGCKKPLVSPEHLFDDNELFDTSLADIQNVQQKRQRIQMPELLRRYPLHDHHDFSLPQDVTCFCQPEGSLNHIVSRKKAHLFQNKQTSFIFTLTEKDSARVRYGICVNFYRRTDNYKIRQGQHPADNDLKASSLAVPKTYYKTFPNKRSERYSKHSVYTLTSICLISHHPFFSLFRECLSILRRIIDACSLRVISTNVDDKCCESECRTEESIWSVLSGHDNCEKLLNAVASEIREIETWILRLLSTPVPIPGKTKVIVSIFCPLIEFLFQTTSQNKTFSFF